MTDEEKKADERWCELGEGRYGEYGVIGAEQADESYYDDRFREEDGEEAFNDHVVKLGRGFIEFDDAPSRNNGEVIGDFRVVKDALLELQTVVVEGVLCPVRELGR